MVKILKKRDWANFARRYNGPGYKKNKYDEKLERAYNKYKT
ncbi:MAG: N-acetylmuramidase domain-containing protein [Thermodesulfobacteriota bacterium]